MTTSSDDFTNFLAGLQAKLSAQPAKAHKQPAKQVWQPKPQAPTVVRIVEKPVIGRAAVWLRLANQADEIIARYVVRYQLIRGRNGSKMYEDCTKAEFDARHEVAEIIESTLKVWGEV
jgi:hypothetical protein